MSIFLYNSGKWDCRIPCSPIYEYGNLLGNKKPHRKVWFFLAEDEEFDHQKGVSAVETGGKPQSTGLWH